MIACLTPFPAEFITIIPVGLRPPGGPGGQKIEFDMIFHMMFHKKKQKSKEKNDWKWSQATKNN